MALENKLGITSSPELAEAEERISKKKAAELFESGISIPLKQVKPHHLKLSTNIFLMIFISLQVKSER